MGRNYRGPVRGWVKPYRGLLAFFPVGAQAGPQEQAGLLTSGKNSLRRLPNPPYSCCDEETTRGRQWGWRDEGGLLFDQLQRQAQQMNGPIRP